MGQPFVQGAKVETMLRDFQRLREAIRAHDSAATEAAWEKCERWIPMPAEQQEDRADRLEAEVARLKAQLEGS